jgi:phosphate-selective porin
MQNANTIKIALGLALGLQAPVFAGTEAPAVEPAPAQAFNFCDWLENKPGTLYKNKENPYLQEFQLEGRFQYQAAYLEGSDVNSRDYNETYDEYRRFRLGAKAKFLQYFGAKYQVNLVDDTRFSGGELDWGYSDIDEAYLSFDLGKALGANNPFDEFQLAYGRQKFLLGHEAHASSTKLLTVERSAISNKVYGSYRPTGLTMTATKGDWIFGGALYSSTTDGDDNEAFNGWQDGVIYYANAGYKVSDQLTLGADLVYNDANRDQGDDSVMSYLWASSLNAQYDAEKWGIIGDFIYGDNGGSGQGNGGDRGGDFWGVVVMPYCWLYKDKLQLVGQYYHQGADDAEGVRVNSRYDRASVPSGVDINSGRGDSQNAFYAGLNYYLCGHNAKLQGGIEYQTMDTPDGDYDTLTYVIAFRSFF